MKEITVITKNETGALANICEILGKTGINLHGIAAQGFEDKGLVKIVTSDPVSSENFLNKGGYQTRAKDLVIVKVMDRPGELGKITKRVSRAGINLDAVYLLNRTGGYVELAIVPDKTEDIKNIIEAVGKEYVI
ncbi:hypothetical protein KO465_06745 [Candidatus Micrarchaeota archaeon]|jgi:hypothetical protein|nr:hypothetical protein [Candidatus Micrarchaeota archaeon]